MSLVMSIILIIVSNYYFSNIMINTYQSGYNYGIDIQYSKDEYDDLTETIINDIREADITDRVLSMQEYLYYILIEKENISDAEKEFNKRLYGEDIGIYMHFDAIFKSDYKEILNTYNKPISIITLNDDVYNKYLNQIGVDRLDNNECILVDYLNEKTKYYDGIRITNYKEGDEITIKSSMTTNIEDLYNNTAKLKIKKISKEVPKEIYNLQGAPMIIGNKNILYNVNKQMFKEDYDNSQMFNFDTIMLQVDNIENINKFIEYMRLKYNLNEYDIENDNNPDNYKSIYGQEYIEQYIIKRENLLRNFFIYGFIGIITLIGILNMYNAINTSLESRKRDIVRLITVGMEERQINKMILIENIICGVLSLILGITIGVVISYIIYYMFIDYWIYLFKIPWSSIIISIIGICLIIFIGTTYLKKKIFASDLTYIL